MTKTFRIATLVASAAAVALTSVPASAATPTTQAQARANIRKPLTIEHVQDLSFGDIVLSGAAPFSANITLTQAGVRSCSAGVTCGGTPAAAVYRLRGSNAQVVNISVSPTLTLTSGANNLVMNVDAPSTVTLTNSGSPGDEFGIGGEITVTDTTMDGLYSATFAVTADYL